VGEDGDWIFITNRDTTFAVKKVQMMLRYSVETVTS
jgi:hypothetical protein